MKEQISKLQTPSGATPLQESAPYHPTSRDRELHTHYIAAPARPGLTITRSCPPVISSKAPLEVVLEDDDQTGDSGTGTGSDSAEYGDRNAWKNAIKDPPPGIIIRQSYHTTKL